MVKDLVLPVVMMDEVFYRIDIENSVHVFDKVELRVSRRMSQEEYVSSK